MTCQDPIAQQVAASIERNIEREMREESVYCPRCGAKSGVWFPGLMGTLAKAPVYYCSRFCEEGWQQEKWKRSQIVSMGTPT